MPRRKLTQPQVDKIKKRYEAVLAGTSPDGETIQDIQNDFGVARTTIYDLRDKSWRIDGRRKGGDQEIQRLQDAVADLRSQLDAANGKIAVLWRESGRA